MRLTAVVLAASVLGCSSNYLPQARGHVAVTMIDGKVAYVRDGRTYPHGILGGGLVDAVRGNPGAEAAAADYHSHMKTGFLATFLGLAAMLGGMTYTTVELARNDGSTNATNAGIGIAAMLGGMVVMLVGTGYLASAEPYRWDAINLFNDAADMQQGPPGWAPPPPSATPRATLRMRDE